MRKYTTNEIFLTIMAVFNNLGNTCYFNVILQMLLHSKNISSKNKSWNSIINKLQITDKCINLKPVLSFLNWNNYFKFNYPHDCHEAFLKLIDITKCSNFEIKLIEFLITETLPLEKQLLKITQNSIEISANCNNLEECLDNYFKTELITNWKDSKNINRNLIKYTFIETPPDKLVFLVRQNYQQQQYINYPLILNISKWFHQNKYKKLDYYLKSVIIYKCFHYYIYCFENSKWILYNDESKIIMNNLNWIKKECPYMLLYEKL